MRKNEVKDTPKYEFGVFRQSTRCSRKWTSSAGVLEIRLNHNGVRTAGSAILGHSKDADHQVYKELAFQIVIRLLPNPEKGIRGHSQAQEAVVFVFWNPSHSRR